MSVDTGLVMQSSSGNASALRRARTPSRDVMGKQDLARHGVLASRSAANIADNNDEIRAAQNDSDCALWIYLSAFNAPIRNCHTSNHVEGCHTTLVQLSKLQENRPRFEFGRSGAVITYTVCRAAN